MDPDQFFDEVRDMLAHLYDRPYLQTHPLADVLVPHQPGEVCGHTLQRLLIAAIEALKPAPDVPYDSLPWRKYRYLYLRYVQGLPVPEIAGDLGISLRQSRRYSHESLTAVARILRDRYQDTYAVNAPARGHQETEATVSDRKQRPIDRAAEVALASEEEPSRAGAITIATSDRSRADTSSVEREAARLEAETEATAASLGEVLAGVFATIKPLADRRGVGLKIPIPSDGPTVAIERTILRQVLLSALSLTLELGPTVVETILDRATAESEVEIQIRCKPRSSAAVTRLLGDERWQVAQRLIETRGGTIASSRADEQQLVVILKVVPTYEWSILVVDDNPDAIELYRRYLVDRPFHVLAALDGAQALARAETDRPAAILLDVMMPARDGWETLQTLKSRPETREIPVIICSVLRERELALALGAADALVKPVRRSDLLRALDQQCRMSQAARRC
ncbi:MAG: response regulator [Chloroflexota bacterium]